MNVDGQLIESLLIALGQQDANARSVVNGILDIVAKCNSLVEQGKLTEAQLVRVARAGEELTKEIMAVRGELTAALPEIYTRLSGLEHSEASQNAALRDMAQVVVGHSEAAGVAIEHVRAIADEGREVAREVSGAIKTMTTDGTRRTGPAAVVRAVAEPIAAFGKLPIASQVILAVVIALLGGAAVAGWVLRH